MIHPIITLVLFGLVGATAGFLSGLLGIGGGVIIVPALTWVMTYTTIPSTILMHMAVGTSLSAMMITSFTAMYAHHRRGNVDWKMWRDLLWGTVPGLALGVLISSHLNTRVLSILFGVMLLLVSAQILFSARKKSLGEVRQLPHYVVAMAGLFTGACSGLLGIGGGVLLIPFFLFCHFPMNRASGTSAAVIFPLSILGTVGFMLTGHASVSAHVAYSTGFIYWPAFLAVGLASVAFVPLGTWVGAKANKPLLKRFFAIFLILVAGQLLF